MPEHALNYPRVTDAWREKGGVAWAQKAKHFSIGDYRAISKPDITVKDSDFTGK